MRRTLSPDSRFLQQELNWIRTQMGQDFALIPSSRSRRIRSVNGGADGDGIDEIGGDTFCKTTPERNAEFRHNFCTTCGRRDALLQLEHKRVPYARAALPLGGGGRGRAHRGTHYSLRPARGRPAESHYSARFKSLLCTIQMSGKEGKGMGAAQSPSSTVGGARLQRGQVCKTSERLLAIRRKVRSTAGTLLRDGGTGRGAHQKLRFHTLLLSPLGTNRLYCHRQGDP